MKKLLIIAAPVQDVPETDFGNMTTKDEALDLALEALRLYQRTLAPTATQIKGEEAITAIKQARSAPEEPLMVDIHPPATQRDRWMYEQGRLAERDPRSHAAPVQEPVGVVQQEPLGFMSEESIANMKAGQTRYAEIYMKGSYEEPIPVYTTPPAAQRQWVSLTTDERYDIRASFRGRFLETSEFAEQVQLATEAKLKEKNNG